MSYVDIPIARLLVVVAMMAIPIVLSRRAGLGLERDLAWGALRGAAQLLAVGYVLLVLFSHQRPAWVALMLAIMLVVAGFTSAQRVDRGPGTARLFPWTLLAITAGSAAALVPVFVFVVVPTPWFEARYLVPIGGMVIANAMNVVALVNERVFAMASAERGRIEAMLALGASPERALAPDVRAALRAALTPTINGLFTVGLVSLPGMMTGQIVSGTAPDHAVRYQIVILYQLVVVASVSGSLAATFARRLLFTKREQLVAYSDDR